MTDFNAPVHLQQWFEGEQPFFHTHEIVADLRLPGQEEELNKAMVTFETKTYVASVTVWGNGMLEFIVLNTVKKEEAVVLDLELNSVAELKVELGKSLNTFVELNAGR